MIFRITVPIWKIVVNRISNQIISNIAASAFQITSMNRQMNGLHRTRHRGCFVLISAWSCPQVSKNERHPAAFVTKKGENMEKSY